MFKKGKIYMRNILFLLAAAVFLCGASLAYAASPQATNDSVSTNEDVVLIISPMNNDDRGDPLAVISQITQPANGSAVFDDATITYTPGADYNGADSITYWITNIDGTDVGLINITVDPVNDPPTANDDSFNVNEDTANNTLNVLGNDSDLENDPLTIDSVGTPNNGGTATTDGATVNYTPAPGFVGIETFTYDVGDGSGATSQATITVDVGNVNDAPVADNDSFTANEDSSNNILDVLANDTDIENDPLTITNVGTPDNGGTATTNGADITYTPAPGFVGIETFTYDISDGNGGSDQATVTVTVQNVNDAPDAVDDSFNADEDSSGNVLDVLANDSDIENDPLTITVVGTPDNGGSATTNGADITYAPAAGFVGLETFTYTISDGNGGSDQATVTVDVGNVNDPPEPSGDSFSTDEDTLLSISAPGILSNDSDPDAGDSLTSTLEIDAANGQVFISPTGGFFYTPDADYNGPDSFTYRATDLAGDWALATVSLTVLPVNDPPIASTDGFNVDEDSSNNSLNVLANDSDIENDSLSISGVGLPDNGGTATTDGATISYSPAPGFVGTESFTYDISDGNGGTDQTTAFVTVGNVNDPPVAGDDGFSVDEDSAGNVLDVLANDTDIENDPLTIASVGPTDNGGTVVNNGTSLSYTPAAGFVGFETFTYDINDGNGGTDQASVTVDVGNVNDPPVAGDDTFTVDEDSSGNTLLVLANDSDIENDPLTITSASLPDNGGTVVNNGTSLSYTPAAGFVGIETFTYEINDGLGGTDTGNVSVTVQNVNDPPVANDDNFNVAEDTSSNPLDVLANDTDIENDSLTITAVGPTDNGGTVVNNGTNLSYTPAVGFVGIETFTYDISDGNGGTDQATATVDVGNVNDPPVANDDAFSTDEDIWLTVADSPGVLGNDTDADVGDSLTASLVTDAANGTVFLNPQGGFIYSPDADFNGVDTFTYRAFDGVAFSDPATVTITVNSLNDQPIANTDIPAIDEDSVNNLLDVLANDVDVDQDTLIISSVGTPDNGGSVTNNGNHLLYSPASGFVGIETFTYDIDDGNGGTDQGTVSVDVRNVNDPPDAVGDTFNVIEDSSANTLDVLGNDTDTENDPLTITNVGPTDNGGKVVNNGGNLSYTPAPGYVGDETFTYEVGDGNGGTDTALVTVTVDPMNFPPDFNTQPYTGAVVDQSYSYRIETSDVENEPITITGTYPAWLTLSDNGDGTAYLFGTPASGDLGDHPVEILANDGNSDGVQAFTITVATQGLIPRDAWSIIFVDSEELVAVSKPVTNILDGDPDSIWHTEWFESDPPHPHEFHIDLGDNYAVTGFRYLPRQGNPSSGAENGRIGTYAFYVSQNGVDWGSPVATGTFNRTDAEKEVTFPAKSARYVRMVALSEINGKPHTTMAEFNLIGGPDNIGPGNEPPESFIDLPLTDVTIQKGDMVHFEGHAVDPENDLPLTHHWHFGDPNIPVNTNAIPGDIQFNVPGVYTVTYTATDLLGAADQSPATLQVTVESNASRIDQSGWSLHYVDSEELIGTFKPGTYAFDNDPDTIWHTEWFESDPPPPHEIQIDLGAIFDLEGFYYLCRQDGVTNGCIAGYAFYVSTDGSTWGNPVATGTFPISTEEQEVLFPSVRGRYIRLVALSEVSGNPWSAVAELNVLGSPAGSSNFPPTSVILQPSGNITAAIGEPLTFTGTGTDPENQVPLTYLWDFGDASIPTSTDQNPAPVQYAQNGTYTVTLTVTDSTGLSDPTPATRTVTITDIPVVLPRDDWSILYVDSEEIIGTYKPASNAIDDNPGSFWHTEWFESDPPHPHEIQIDMGKVYFVDGFRYWPRPDDPDHGGDNGMIKDYAFYVSQDGIDWGDPVATGTFPKDHTIKNVSSPRALARYVRLVALSEVNGKPHTTMAEFYVHGNNVFSTLEVSPTSAASPANGTVNFTASLGEPPYVFSIVDNQSGASIDPNTGVYTAGPTTGVTDTIQVQDTTFYSVTASVNVVAPVVITPSSAVIAVGGTKDFNTIHGVPPFTFSLTDNQSGAQLDPATGVYVAGTTKNTTDTVRVDDSAGTFSQALVTVVDAPLWVTPKSDTVNVGETINFIGSGGTPPYTYALTDNQSGASINTSTGVYTAGGVTSVTDWILVTDADNNEIYATVEVVAPPLSQSGWSIHFVDSEELEGNFRPAENAIDGDPSTIWHTQWFAADPVHPHEVQINMGAVYDIDGFRYLPRQDGANGRIAQFEFYVSLDGVNWGEPVARSFFENNATEQEVTFPTESAQFIRLVALTGFNGNPWTSVAELNVLGLPFSGNLAPQSVITLPIANFGLDVGRSLRFEGSGNDPDGNTPLSYHWTFGDPAIPDRFVQNPGYITFNNPGTYTVSLTVTDSLGRSDSTPAQRVIKVRNGSGNHLVPQDRWELVSVSSEELSAAPRPAIDSFDGDINTFWHTEWFENLVQPPHEITFNLGSAHMIWGLNYLPRQDWITGRIKDYLVHVSIDGKNWGNPVTAGTWGDSGTEKIRLFIPKMGQFVKLVALSTNDANPYVAAAELNIQGACTDPFLSIIDPDTNNLQQGPDLVIQTSVCLNSTDNAGWGVKFKVDGNTVQTINLPGDGVILSDTFTATIPGLLWDNHTIETIVVDDQGNEILTDDTYDIVTDVGVGDYYVAIGDSIPAGFGDDDVSDNISLDGRNSGGGFAPVLNNLLTAAKGYPHSVVKDTINGEKTAEGLARLPDVIDRHPYAGYYLVQYGTNDQLNNLRSGLNLQPGDPLYNGSYKDLMQQMIDMIRAAGKEVYLSKCPYSLFPGLNTSLQAYNDVVDQLATENNIPVVPPDLYTWFEQHQNELGDELHPNGEGYRSMATQWFNAIMNPLP